jgi:hypothetical protein
MKFQQALLEDVDTIHEINQKYLRTNLPDMSNGFLLGDRSKEWISENLDRYFVAKEDDHILGYAEIDFEIGDENFASGNWENKEIQDEIFEKIKNNKFIYMIQLASNEHRKGVGEFITNGLSEKFSDSIIISFVAYKPFYNEISKKFHEKAQFRKVGLFQMKNKFGIPGYERICYIK